MTATAIPGDCLMESPMRQEIGPVLRAGLAVSELKSGQVRLTGRGRRYFARHLRTLKLDPTRVISIEDLCELLAGDNPKDTSSLSLAKQICPWRLL
ncbi:MAG: hypothetical protein V4650_01855 [Pseudomonadota bacterium]